MNLTLKFGLMAVGVLSDDELEEIREWHITNLLKLKEVFQPEIERALETLNSSEKEES